MLWDVTYATLWMSGPHAGCIEHGRVIQVEADTISRANSEAKVLIGRNSGIVRIDRAYPEVPEYDPSKTKIQGAP